MMVRRWPHGADGWRLRSAVPVRMQATTAVMMDARMASNGAWVAVLRGDFSALRRLLRRVRPLSVQHAVFVPNTVPYWPYGLAAASALTGCTPCAVQRVLAHVGGSGLLFFVVWRVLASA